MNVVRKVLAMSQVHLRDNASWREVLEGIKNQSQCMGATDLAKAARAAEPLKPSSDRATAVAAIRQLQSRADELHSYVVTLSPTR